MDLVHHLARSFFERRFSRDGGRRKIHIHDRLREIRELQGKSEEGEAEGVDEMLVYVREDRLAIRALAHNLVVDELLVERLVERRENKLLAFDAHRKLVHHEGLHRLMVHNMRHRIHDVDFLGELKAFYFVFKTSLRMHIAIFVERL